MKSLHNVTLKRVGKEPWGFRIIGGVDQGKTFQVFQNEASQYFLNLLSINQGRK